MKELGLRERLLKYMKANHTQWFPSGHLQRLVVQHTKHTPRSCVRRLQEMCEDGLLEKKLVKNHAHYRFLEKVTHPAQRPSPHNKQTCEGCIMNREAVAAWN